MSTDFHSESTMYANPAYRPQLAYSEELPDQGPSLHLQEANPSPKRSGVAVAAALIAAGAMGAALGLALFDNAEPPSTRSVVVVPGAEANPAPAPAPVVSAPEHQPAPDPVAGAAGSHQVPANRPVSGPAGGPAGNRQAPAVAVTSPNNQGGLLDVKGPEANVGVAPVDAPAEEPAVVVDVPLPQLPQLPQLPALPPLPALPSLPALLDGLSETPSDDLRPCLDCDFLPPPPPPIIVGPPIIIDGPLPFDIDALPQAAPAADDGPLPIVDQGVLVGPISDFP